MCGFLCRFILKFDLRIHDFHPTAKFPRRHFKKYADRGIAVFCHAQSRAPKVIPQRYTIKKFCTLMQTAVKSVPESSRISSYFSFAAAAATRA